MKLSHFQTHWHFWHRRGVWSFFECLVTFHIVGMLKWDRPSNCLWSLFVLMLEYPHWDLGHITAFDRVLCPTCKMCLTPLRRISCARHEVCNPSFPFFNVHIQVHLYDRLISLYRTMQWMVGQAWLTDQEFSAGSSRSLLCSVQGEQQDFQSYYKWPGWKNSAEPATVIK